MLAWARRRLRPAAPGGGAAEGRAEWAARAGLPAARAGHCAGHGCPGAARLARDPRIGPGIDDPAVLDEQRPAAVHGGTGAVDEVPDADAQCLHEASVGMRRPFRMREGVGFQRRCFVLLTGRG